MYFITLLNDVGMVGYLDLYVYDDDWCRAQVVGWPPIRSYRKNCVQQPKNKGCQERSDGAEYVKVSMDGAPYLRKIHLRVYNCYPQLLKALQNMFKCTFGKNSYIPLTFSTHLFVLLRSQRGPVTNDFGFR